MTPDLKSILARLQRSYGKPELPPAKGPFELVMWENACYLLADARRQEVFESLRERVGLTADAIWQAEQSTLLELARRGGMRPETRVFRWREIARITRTEFGGDLDSVLARPFAEAKRALCKFPNLGQPGAEKILMQCGKAQGLPLESNGCRVLLRLGFGRPQKSYGGAYRSIQEVIAGQIPQSAESITRAHVLLRTHGKETCKTTAPACASCCLVSLCPAAQP